MAETEEMLAAIQAGDAETLQRLLDATPALAGARDANGVSALQHALYHRRPDLAQRLLAAGHRPDLFEAACLGHADRVREILAADAAAADTLSADGFTPLHLAAFFGQTEVARVLLEAGAAVGPVARNPMQVFPLQSAAAGRSVDVVRLLLAHGADPNTHQVGGYTALMSAAGNGDTAMIKALLAAGADPTSTADDGRTAADLANERGHPEVVPLLQSRSA